MKLDIIIPVYRNAGLVETCLETLIGHLGEVAGHSPRIIVINDSPDDADVMALLERFRRAGTINELIVNAYNQGFVRSVNRGLQLARDRGAAALLVNSDTLTYKNTIAEMLAVMALDPQIGFVSPRSNNASISTFPQIFDQTFSSLIAPEAGYQAWGQLRHHLPRFSWVPTAVGFYMLIAPDVVRNFAPLDESFGIGYEEENDLVMRAGKVGYRAVLANQAFAFHAGSASFLLQNIDLKGQRQGNLQKMTERHPEFLPLIREYEASSEYLAEYSLKQLLPVNGKLKIAINLLTFGKHHNGTSEHMMHFLRWCDASAPDRFEIHVICKPSVAAFHSLDKLHRLKVRQDVEPLYAIAIFPGQPFDIRMIDIMERLAPITIYGMLDVIALDCSHLRATDDVQPLWAYLAQHADGLFFISNFAELTFRHRFERQFSARYYTRLLPTKLAPYETRYRGLAKGRDHILVMGNHFAHKGSEEAGALIAEALPYSPMVILGGATETRGNARTIQAGVIPEAEMDALMANSSVVVLPSYYEGFGLSLMHALSLGKPVVLRDIPPTREILATFRQMSGIFLFNDNREIPALVQQAFAAGMSSVSDADCFDWHIWSQGLLDFCDALLQEPHLHRRLVNRIEAAQMLRVAIDNRQPAGFTAAKSPASFAQEGIRLADMLQLEGEAFVRSMYQQLLGRPAEPAGLEHHIALLNNGTSKVEMLKSIIGSTEFAEAFPKKTLLDLELLEAPKRRRSMPRIAKPAESAVSPVVQLPQPDIVDADVDIAHLLTLDDRPFVLAIYEKLLRRPADPAGLAHHLTLLERGETRQGMLKAILESHEFSGLAPLKIANLSLLAPPQRSWVQKVQKAMRP